MDENSFIEISLWKSTAAMWASLVFFIFCFSMSWLSGQIEATPWFIPFILGSSLWLAFYQKVKANKEELKLKSFFGEYKIKWVDIDRIEKGQSLIVFFKGKNRLSIPLSNWWSGKQKVNMIKIIDTLIEESQIEVKQTFRADFMLPKGTKDAKP